ncbi:hypothetical protein SISSUDRAFT_1128983 [Sistotremastrum suecicum HHB10207 ss-3]|uniref:DUF6699 domain-containing protein n=1 Tax=Sistotremastrum suecicum HHB10207 ss-3 TaxID=1314776 RepID=A0A166D8B1_9AGAM|nr:hypothetical protein SISSUDRAFT_1128983 [Sistotremastrum suecicum HHB10207 ss-3]
MGKHRGNHRQWTWRAEDFAPSHASSQVSTFPTSYALFQDQPSIPSYATHEVPYRVPRTTAGGALLPPQIMPTDLVPPPPYYTHEDAVISSARPPPSLAPQSLLADRFPSYTLGGPTSQSTHLQASEELHPLLSLVDISWRFDLTRPINEIIFFNPALAEEINQPATNPPSRRRIISCSSVDWPIVVERFDGGPITVWDVFAALAAGMSQPVSTGEWARASTRARSRAAQALRDRAPHTVQSSNAVPPISRGDFLGSRRLFGGLTVDARREGVWRLHTLDVDSH